MPYHVMAARPRKALMQLNTNATIPRAVNLLLLAEGINIDKEAKLTRQVEEQG